MPYATNAGVIRRLLPKGADFRLAQGAAHYSFLMPCGLLGPPQLCKDAQGFDRKHFHEEFNRQVVAHFRAHLAAGPPTPRTDQ